MTELTTARPERRDRFRLLGALVLSITIGSFVVLLRLEPPEALVPPRLFATIAFDVMLALLLTYAALVVTRTIVRGRLYSLKVRQAHTPEQHRSTDSPCLGVMVVDNLRTEQTRTATNRALKDIPYVCHKVFSNQRPPPDELKSLQECLDLASLIIVIGEEREKKLPEWAHAWVARPLDQHEKKIAYFLHVRPTALRSRFLAGDQESVVFSSAHELEAKLRELVGQNAINRFRSYHASTPALARR